MALQVILGFILFVVGGLIAYLAKHTYRFIFKQDPDNVGILKVKVVGFVIFLTGAALIFTYLR